MSKTAKNAIMTRGEEGESIAFKVNRKNNKADVFYFEKGWNPDPVRTYENIPIEHANNLWITALAAGYKVAF